MICPLENDFGVKFKAAEALAHGTPLLASRQTLLGLPYLDEEPALDLARPDEAARVSPMSSRDRSGWRCARRRSTVLLFCVHALERCEDDAGELSLEAAQSLAGAFAFGFFSLQVCDRWRVDSFLRDGDAMKRAVELPVASPVEPVAFVFARRGWQRRAAGVLGKLGFG
jgi:hypothetical protein